MMIHQEDDKLTTEMDLKIWVKTKYITDMVKIISKTEDIANKVLMRRKIKILATIVAAISKSLKNQNIGKVHQ